MLPNYVLKEQLRMIKEKEKQVNKLKRQWFIDIGRHINNEVVDRLPKYDKKPYTSIYVVNNIEPDIGKITSNVSYELYVYDEDINIIDIISVVYDDQLLKYDSIATMDEMVLTGLIKK